MQKYGLRCFKTLPEFIAEGINIWQVVAQLAWVILCVVQKTFHLTPLYSLIKGNNLITDRSFRRDGFSIRLTLFEIKSVRLSGC